MGTAPCLHRAFFGSNLQRLRSAEPQGRLTDHLAGFRSREGSSRPLRAVSAVGTAGPAVRGSSCSLPASSEPRGAAGCPEVLHLPGQERGPSPRPRCARLKGRAEDGHVKRLSQSRARSGFGRGKMLHSPTRSLSRRDAGAPGGRPRADPHSPQLPGAHPVGRAVPRRKREERVSFSLSPQETALPCVSDSCVTSPL